MNQGMQAPQSQPQPMTQSAPQPMPQPQPMGGTNAPKMGKNMGMNPIMYIAVIVVVIVVVGAAYEFVLKPAPATTTTSVVTTKATTTVTSLSTTIAPVIQPVYLSEAQVTSLFQEQPLLYLTQNVLNASSTSTLGNLDNQTQFSLENVSGAWATLAVYINRTKLSNASILFYVMRSSNAKGLGELLSSDIPVPPSNARSAVNLTSGAQDGLNYTYETFYNKTANVQLMAGWKDNYAILVYVEDKNITITKSELTTITASTVP
jgi:hypothetical protein